MKQTQTPVHDETVIPEHQDEHKVAAYHSEYRLSRITTDILLFIFLLSAAAAFVGLYLNNCTGTHRHPDRSSVDTIVLQQDSNVIAHILKER